MRTQAIGGILEGLLSLDRELWLRDYISSEIFSQFFNEMLDDTQKFSKMAEINNY